VPAHRFFDTLAEALAYAQAAAAEHHTWMAVWRWRWRQGDLDDCLLLETVPPEPPEG
jgi:hypothetical protein